MDPELLQQLAAAGMTEDQIAALQPRLKMGEQWLQPQMAQGRNVGNTYVASSPLEHLSNAIRQIAGGALAGGALGKERDLLAQRQKARGDYMQALQTAQAGGQGGTLGMEGGGMARPPDPQAARGLEMAGVASGDPAMAGAAHFGMQSRHLDLQTAQMADLMRHRGVLEGQGQERIGIAGDRQKLAEDALALRGVKWDQNAGQFVNVGGMAKPRKPLLPRSTGGGTPPPAAPPPLPGGAPPPPTQPVRAPLGKWQDKALKELGSDFNPSSGRAGEFGKNQQRVNAAKRVMALAVDENGNARDLNPQQMPELAQSVAALIGGSSTAQAQIEHLLPKSYSRDAAGILQYFTNEPHGAGQQAFVQNMVDTAKREQAVAQQGIDQVRGSLAMKHQRILRSNPNEARNVLKGFGWDLGPDGMPVQQQAAAPAPGADTAALRKKYGL